MRGRSSRPPKKRSGGSQGRGKNDRSKDRSSHEEFSDRVIVGTHAVNEALKVRPRSIIKVFLRNDWDASEDLVDVHDYCQSKGITIETRKPGFFEAYTSVHQGVLALSNETPQVNLSRLAEQDTALVVFLDGLTDPHNLGAIMRTAWLLNVDAIVVPSHRSVAVTPTAVKVACGGAEHVPVLEVSSLQQEMDDLKQSGFWFYGLSHRAEKVISDFEFTGRVGLVIGSEDKGMRTPVERACDELVRLPQAAADASYNASVATAMALYEVRKQLT